MKKYVSNMKIIQILVIFGDFSWIFAKKGHRRRVRPRHPALHGQAHGQRDARRASLRGPQGLSTKFSKFRWKSVKIDTMLHFFTSFCIKIITFLKCQILGYVLRITGGNDKQGFPMMQGVLSAQRVRQKFYTQKFRAQNLVPKINFQAPKSPNLHSYRHFRIKNFKFEICLRSASSSERAWRLSVSAARVPASASPFAVELRKFLKNKFLNDKIVQLCIENQFWSSNFVIFLS